MADVDVVLSWTGEGQQFRGGRAAGPELSIDGDGVTAPGPMTALALAVAGCMAIDVLDITRKMRLRITTLAVAVAGDRRADPPRHYTLLRLRYRVGGVAPADEDKVWRAIDLSRDKYCSVLHSLRSDIDVTIELDLV